MRFWGSSRRPVYYVGETSTASQLLHCSCADHSAHGICPSHSSAGVCDCAQSQHSYPPAPNRLVSHYALQYRPSGRSSVRTPGHGRTARLVPNTHQRQPPSGVPTANKQHKRKSWRQLIRRLYERPVDQQHVTVIPGRTPRPASTSRKATGSPPPAPLNTPNPPTPPAPPASPPAGARRSHSADSTRPYVHRTPPTADQRRVAAGYRSSSSSSRDTSPDRKSNGTSPPDPEGRARSWTGGNSGRVPRSSPVPPPQIVEPPRDRHDRGEGSTHQQHGNTGSSVPPAVILPRDPQIMPGQPTPRDGGTPGRSGPRVNRAAAVSPGLSYQYPGGPVPGPPPPLPPPSPPRAQAAYSPRPQPSERGTFPPNHRAVVPAPGLGQGPGPQQGEYLQPHAAHYEYMPQQSNRRSQQAGRRSRGGNQPRGIEMSPFPPPSLPLGQHQTGNAPQNPDPSFGQSVGGFIDRVSTAMQNYTPFRPPTGPPPSSGPPYNTHAER